MAHPDAYALAEDDGLVVYAPSGVLINTSDRDSDPLQSVLVGDVTDGVLNLNATDGSFDYTPALDFNGIDRFTYRANNGEVNSKLVNVTLIVSGVNDAPVAMDDGYQMNPNTTMVVPVETGVLATGLNDHRLLNSLRQAALGPPWQIKLHGFIYSVYTFVIPRVPIRSKTAIALPKIPARAFLNDRIQGFDYNPVP